MKKGRSFKKWWRDKNKKRKKSSIDKNKNKTLKIVKNCNRSSIMTHFLSMMSKESKRSRRKRRQRIRPTSIQNYWEWMKPSNIFLPHWLSKMRKATEPTRRVNKTIQMPTFSITMMRYKYRISRILAPINTPRTLTLQASLKSLKNNQKKFCRTAPQSKI